MPDAPRLVPLTIELRYDTTPEEQAVFDSDDETAHADLEQSALREVVELVEQSGIAASRFRLGQIEGSTGSSWITRFPS